MSTIFNLRRSADEDGQAQSSGGKIARRRRTPAADTTPYARPHPAPANEPSPESSGNPNWLSGLILPARAIASGAGRILSAVFGPDSLSSSSSSSGGDFYSEDEDDASNGVDVDLNKVFSSVNTKSENVHLIQQLVMQQTFSREECDELIKLIRSRVVKWDWNLSNPEIKSGACNNVVMEARKWLEEKKSRSSSKLMGEDYGAVSLVIHGETGSPVDMAKSYMEGQPTWSSPASKHVEFTTPLPIQNSKEIFHSPVTPVQLSEMNGSALSTGSWNIVDEIRRVRSKATEELLAKTPSTKISLASASVEDKSMQDTMTNNVHDEKIGDKLHSLTSLTSNSDPNASLDFPATESGSVPEYVEMECERSQGGALQTDNASVVPKQCQFTGYLQDGESIQATGDSDAANKTDPVVSSDQLDGCRIPHEMNGLRDSATKDHALSLSVADQTLVPCSKEKADGTGPDNLQLQNERSNHALHADDNDRVLSGSRDSSSMLYEDSLQDAAQSDPNHKRKDAPPGRNLRPRTKRGRGNII